MSSELHTGDSVSYRSIDPSEWESVYVIGDVHGCHDALDRLCSTLPITDDDLVVFVGDLLRKGPDSAAVVRTVREADNMYSVRGNNEEKIIRGEKALPELDGADREWIASLPVAIGWNDGLVVHGGVDPRMSLAEHTVDDLQNTRSIAPEGGYEPPFWYDRYEGPRRVFFGHTVLEEPIERRWAVGLDTGCVYGGSLTAYDLRNERFRSVPAHRPGLDRSDAKIVSAPKSGRSK